MKGVRRNLAEMAGVQPRLPGVDPDVISLKAAARMLGIERTTRALARFGLTPLGELAQQTRWGPLTFRTYDRAAVLRAKERKDREDARERERAEHISRTVARTVRESRVLQPMAERVPQDPTLGRQVMGVLCDIRNTLRDLLRKAHQQQPSA